MKANYAEICRVGNLEADFQQVMLVQIFWNFHNNSNSVKKNKIYFLRSKLKKKSFYYRKCIGQTKFWV